MNNANDLLSSGTKMRIMTIDWISTTAHDGSTDGYRHAFPNLRDATHWTLSHGALGYNQGAKHTLGVKQYRHTDRRDMGTHTIYTGNAIRRIEEMYGNESFDLLHYHVKRGDHISRLDIAIDFVNCGVTVDDFVVAWQTKEVRTRITTATIVKSLSFDGHTFYIGSRKARKKLVRVYDKASEQGLKGDWIRVEYQIMGKPALQASRRMIKANDVKSEMVRIMRGICDFPSVNVWSQVTEGTEPMRIGSISSEKGDTRRWIREQVIKAVAREIVLDASYWVQFKLMLESEINAQIEIGVGTENGGV